MKNLLFTLLLVTASISANAQRVIEKNIDYNDQLINVEIPFASEIELKTWNKPEIYIKANLTTDEGKYLDLYELDIDESNNKINIVSKAEALFKEYQKDYKQTYNDKDKKGSTIVDGDIIIHDGMKYKFDYVIYIPEGAEFKLSSINGNLNSEVVKGDFSAELINGNIDIKEYSGDLKLSTINGEINLAVGDSNMTAETIHGNIYADENLKFTSEDRMIGQEIESKNLNSSNRLQLSTINGNMYLR